jgi:integrase
MDTARKHSRHGHRDSTMILTAYRHGLRASEVCDLQWQQIELDQGRLHVRRAKRGTPSIHPIRGDEIRALRKLRRENATEAHEGPEGLGTIVPTYSFRTRKARRRGALGGSVSDQFDIAAARSRTRLRAACCDLCA